MMISPVSHSMASNSSNAAAQAKAGDTSAAYLQLLVAELQAQDPTSPLDPNQMTAQIVSLNQLDQLIQIKNILSGLGQ
jgi:flagellar basal-body rod modification protein FlgD